METNLKSNDGNTPIKRLSLPLGSAPFTEEPLVPNRRHTLVPSRSILKPNIDGNHTINILPNVPKEIRRVSFAPEVTLHKINFSKANEDRKSKRKGSLLGTSTQSSVSKLSTSQFIGKVYPTTELVETAPKRNNFSSVSNNLTKDIPNELDTPSKPQFVIDDDTQAMEMSVELTQQILKQQEQMKEQNDKNVEPENISDARNSLRDLFDEVDEELNENDEQVEMELTETIQYNPQNPQELDQTKDLSMELTQTAHMVPVLTSEPLPNAKYDNKNDEEILLNTRAELGLPINTDNVADEEMMAMEFTQPIQSIVDDGASAVEATEFSQMEFTQPIVVSNNQSIVSMNQVHDKQLFSKDNVSLAEETTDMTDEESVMEFTQPISKEQEENEVPIITSDDKLSVVIEVSEPPTSAYSESKEYEKVVMDVDNNMKNMEQHALEMEETEIFKSPQKLGISNSITNKDSQDYGSVQNESQITEESFLNDRDTSEMESSLIGTEMIPLAEVTADHTENQEDYDSDNSFTDDNHVNVSLDVFLNDVNVQFFDNIGPSESEIEQTLVFNPDSRSSLASSSPSTVSSNSTTSTPTTHLHNKKSNLIDYIDACTNIPYYHYIVHLINQYKSSIQSIATMVNTFSNDLLESNPTAIREYYQQIDEVKNDLCTNYQAIATFTRKQAKCQNTRFVGSLLGQLSLSYERANQLLEADLAKAIEWRRGVLIERQHMIERKVELDQYIQKLNALKDNWSSINVENIKKSNEELRSNRSQIQETKHDIAETSESITLKNSLLLEKRARKERLLQEIKELKLKINKSKVPTKQDLGALRDQLLELEKEKSIKLVSTDNITFLIMNSLQVEFKKMSEECYTTIITLENKEKFNSFLPLIEEFLFQYQGNRTDLSTTMDFIKSLASEWKKIVSLWKDLLKISFLHSGTIENNMFKFEFSISDPIGLEESTFFIEAKLSDLLDLEKAVNIKVVNGNENSKFKENELLDNLKKPFDNKNSVINRLIVE